MDQIELEWTHMYSTTFFIITLIKREREREERDAKEEMFIHISTH